jgi:DNA-binding MarR family transcriptional regulator
VVRRYDELMACVAASHAPDFVAVDVTMAQLKVLYLVAARDSLNISALADLLGVTLSTGSGVVDRLVDHGLLERRHDPVDRRHVVVSLTPAGRALIERMRELSSRRVRPMLVELDGADLAALERVLASFIRQVSADIVRVDPHAPTQEPTVPQQEGTR